jgi:hypothetical protein
MSLLREFTGVPSGQAPNLKNSDSSDAGKADVSGKLKPNDVSFSLMRNTINSDGDVTGSNVADYLEKAHELNDEVETVPFGLETDDGDIVKVYVNAEEADKFEDAMKKLLGVEDDIEEAINKLAQDFDIIDVVWPKDKDDDGTEGDEDVQLGTESDFDALDDGDEMEEVARYDPLGESKVVEDVEPETDDPKAPTPEEAAAYSKIMNIVMNLAAMGPSGVSAATGLDRSNMTKLEMIKEYVKTEYADDANLARTWMKRVGDSIGDSRDILPYWLKEQLESEAHDVDDEGEEDMTIGSQFLARLAEGKEPAKKGYKFDPATESMKRQLRDIGGEKNFADKIAEVAAMSGMQGRFMNTPEGRESVLAGAKGLRTRPAATAAFLALHSALAAFHGYTPMAEGKDEEADLDGVAFQQLVEEVLVELGIPQSLVSEGGKAGAKSTVKRMIAKIMQDSTTKVAYQFLAKKLGIKVNDKIVGTKKAGKPETVEEAVGADPAVVKLFNKIKGEPNLKAARVKALVTRYLSMVDKQEKHIPMLTAEVIHMLQDADLMEAVTRGTVGTDGQGTEDSQAETSNVKDYTAAAKTILSALGVNLEDTKLVRVVNDGALQRAMRTALRDGKVKRAASAFLRVLSQGE